MKIQQTMLANGLRIITAEMHDARSLTANIAVGTGSRYEDFAVNGGVSHFLEHLLFKGTAKYPSAHVIAETIDAVGGFNNAYTSEDLTLYYIKVPARHGGLALDILTDMVRSPLLEPEEVDRERGVIIEEMNVFRDDPARFIHTLIPELIFPDNPLGQDIIGQEEVVRRIPTEDIRHYMKRHYGPNAMVVGVAGAVRHENVVRQVEEALGEMASSKSAVFPEVGLQVARELAMTETKPTAQAHFMIAGRAYAYEHERDQAARVLTAILGRGMSSRLFTNVRERQGLAYTVYSELNSFVDTGMFYAYAGVNLDKIPQAIDAVLHELDRVRQEPPELAELRKAQQQLRAGLEMSLESNGAVADRLATQLLLLGKAKPVDEAIAEIEAVTAEQVHQVAQEMLAPAGLRLAVISPEPKVAADHFEDIITAKKEN